MKRSVLLLVTGASLLSGCASLDHHADKSSMHSEVADEVISHQRRMLAESTTGKGFGPQAPRDISLKQGTNSVTFSSAPDRTNMNLCNIHFHESAEHKGGEFTKYAGNGDGHGYHSGFKYTGALSSSELTPIDHNVCPSKHGDLSPGDTIEVHYVYSTAEVKPGPTLGSCLSETTKNPQLRVEAQVYVLVNDPNALDFKELTMYGEHNGYQQALGIPNNTGTPVNYIGSTTGPGYNEQGSPFQVSWSVRPKVSKVNINTVGEWCKGNVFKEDHAHGVRNLVKNSKLLSKIKP